MTNWECKNCRKETDHQIEQTGQEKYKDYKILICQVCGEKEMVPENIIEQQEDDSLKVNWGAIQE